MVQILSSKALALFKKPKNIFTLISRRNATLSVDQVMDKVRLLTVNFAILVMGIL